MTIRGVRRILIVGCGLLMLAVLGLAIDGVLSGHMTGSRLMTLTVGVGQTALCLYFISELNRRERMHGPGALAMSRRAWTIRLGLIGVFLVLVLAGVYAVLSQAPSQ